ncbi:MAG: quinone-dependent dihydroorotate dehydrogenase [Xanthobacteraceae bacterium]
MIGLLDRLARPLLYALDPEDAHRLAIRMLQLAPLPPAGADDRRLASRVFGLNFPNPIGLAAGFDKHAEIPDALLRAGFGFVEVGTVTPLPQPGNPRPRLFRLDGDQGVINRLGFNSEGAEAVLRRLAARARLRGMTSGIVGINVGANKDAPDRVADYVQLIENFAAVASYVTVNISSPNTPGLRDLQQASVLDDLLARVIDARERVARNAGPTPVLLKIAPDLSLPDLDDVVAVARARRVDGMIVGNTTVTRPTRLRDPQSREAGGLSGRPLLPLADRILAETYVRVEGVFPLVGAGGIDSGSSALGKIRAGASLVQIYSGLVFRGLGLLDEIKAAMLAAIERDASQSIADYVGADAAAVTAEAWPA